MTYLPGDQRAYLFKKKYDTFVFSSEYLRFGSVPMCIIRAGERKHEIGTWIYICLLIWNYDLQYS